MPINLTVAEHRQTITAVLSSWVLLHAEETGHTTPATTDLAMLCD